MNIFVNFPVADVERSKAFSIALGWSLKEGVSDDNAACFVLDDDKYVMALRRDYYASLGGDEKEVGDPATTRLATIAFDFPTRADVDAFIAKAEAAGAKIGETGDYGFMYQRQFDDPDGNHFAPFWMDPAGILFRLPLAHNVLAYALTERGAALRETIEALRRWGATT